MEPPVWILEGKVERIALLYGHLAEHVSARGNRYAQAEGQPTLAHLLSTTEQGDASRKDARHSPRDGRELHIQQVIAGQRNGCLSVAVPVLIPHLFSDLAHLFTLSLSANRYFALAWTFGNNFRAISWRSSSSSIVSTIGAKTYFHNLRVRLSSLASSISSRVRLWRSFFLNHAGGLSGGVWPNSSKSMAAAVCASLCS